jgi:UDP-GlcNAc:undecaprenyl-phosphate GlcNAc-1-phosphate transferase
MYVVAGALILAVAGVAASILTPIVRRRALNSDLVDRPGGRKVHGRTTPYGGGLVLVTAVFAPLALGAALALAGSLSEDIACILPASIATHLPGVRQKLLELLAIAGGAVVLSLVGHIDDRRGLSPWTRLGIEILAATALVLSGVRGTLFAADPLLPSLLSILFIVFVTNCMNFIDNQDGLLLATASTISALLLVMAVESGQLFIAAFLLAVLGAVLVLLRHNFPPASIFTGDAGSLPLGFILSAISLEFSVPSEGPNPMPVLVPLLVMGVPFADGVTVVVSRLRRGVSPFTPGTDHLSHRLKARGLTPKRLVLAFFLLTLASGLPAVLWFVLRTRLGASMIAGALVTLAAGAAVLLLLGILIPRKRPALEPLR